MKKSEKYVFLEKKSMDLKQSENNYFLKPSNFFPIYMKKL